MRDCLCLRYLAVIFHPSGTICDENVRSYPEATIIVERLFCQFVVFPRFLVCLLLLIYIFYLTCYFLLACRFSPTWDHLCPSYLGMIFSREWDHLCPKYLGTIFHPGGTICAQDFYGWFFSGEWDHLCPIYLGVIFHPRGTICNQNGRFYLEATVITERLFSQFAVFPRFLICFLLVTYIFLFDLLFFCLLVGFHPHGTICARDIFREDLFTRIGPCIPEIGVISHPSGSICVGDI